MTPRLTTETGWTRKIAAASERPGRGRAVARSGLASALPRAKKKGARHRERPSIASGIFRPLVVKIRSDRAARDERVAQVDLHARARAEGADRLTDDAEQVVRVVEPRRRNERQDARARHRD